MSAPVKVCAHCRREGIRGFVPSHRGSWVCKSGRACERRIRTTGENGIGVMRSYVR